ncbi:unnamed protein product [Pieris brassicae]|uniref:Endoplasmic reticulum transmembrane protein n=2 Tax=Pieris brassicae TaxID=7116 RepID=A0A9P0T7H8_PIEBR|nr:unnamed protein product [Pieris brassicae]
MFQQQAAVYFYVLLGVLALFLMDAVREMRKYSHATDHVHLTNEMKGNVKLFRAQRNFYITGFAIFLAFVIRRLVTMIIIQHELELKAQEIIMKAEDTVQMAKSTLIEHKIEDASDIAVLTHKFTLTKALLDEQKLRVQELEAEATMWRLKYEEMQGNKSGQGDE